MVRFSSAEEGCARTEAQIIAQREWYRRNKTAISERRRLRYAENREEIRERKRREYRENSTAYIRRAKEYKKTEAGRRVNRNVFLKTRYGISIEEWDRMAAEQGGRCAICRREKIRHTDHCHATGKVRGLLCHGCNLGLGGFRDSQEALIRAINYLDRQLVLKAA